MKFISAIITAAIVLATQVAIGGATPTADGYKPPPPPPARVCLKACWPKQHACDKGWSASHSGYCWTCCQDPKKGYGGGHYGRDGGYGGGYNGNYGGGNHGGHGGGHDDDKHGGYGGDHDDDKHGGYGGDHDDNKYDDHHGYKN